MFSQQVSGGWVTGDGRRGSTKREERNLEKTIGTHHSAAYKCIQIMTTHFSAPLPVKIKVLCLLIRLFNKFKWLNINLLLSCGIRYSIRLLFKGGCLQFSDSSLGKKISMLLIGHL